MDSFEEFTPAEFLGSGDVKGHGTTEVPRIGALRPALTGVALECEKLFSMRLPYANGAFFFGAQLPESMFPNIQNPYLNAAGRGISLIEAFHSCMGEMAEIIAIQQGWRALRARVDGPSGATVLGVDDLLGTNSTDKVQGPWVEVQSLLGSETTKVPAEALFRLPESARVSNHIASNDGMGAGNTLEAAICTGILELVERDSLALWWYGGRAARRLTTGELGSLQVTDLAVSIGRSPDRRWWVLEIENEFQIPVCCVVSSDQKGGDVVAGFAARATLAEAAKAALLEMSQMELASVISNIRAAKVEHTELTATDLKWVANKQTLSVKNQPKLYSQGAHNRYSEDKADFTVTSLAQLIAAKGFQVFYVEIPTEAPDMHVVKTLVPGLQPMTATYRTQRLNTYASAKGLDVKNIPPLM